MRTYLITYDLSAPARHNLAGAIMQLGDAWARPLDATWYVQSSERADALERRLKPHLEGEDGLLIQQVEADAVPARVAVELEQDAQARGVGRGEFPAVQSQFAQVLPCAQRSPDLVQHLVSDLVVQVADEGHAQRVRVGRGQGAQGACVRGYGHGSIPASGVRSAGRARCGRFR